MFHKAGAEIWRAQRYVMKNLGKISVELSQQDHLVSHTDAVRFCRQSQIDNWTCPRTAEATRRVSKRAASLVTGIMVIWIGRHPCRGADTLQMSKPPDQQVSVQISTGDTTRPARSKRVAAILAGGQKLLPGVN